MLTFGIDFAGENQKKKNAAIEAFLEYFEPDNRLKLRRVKKAFKSYDNYKIVKDLVMDGSMRSYDRHCERIERTLKNTMRSLLDESRDEK